MTALFEMDASLLSAGLPSAQNSAAQTEPARGADFIAALSELSAGDAEASNPAFSARADEPSFAKLINTPTETALPATRQLDLTVETDPTVQIVDPERVIAAQTPTAPSETTQTVAARPDEGAAQLDPRQVPAASGDAQWVGNDVAADIHRAVNAADAPAQMAVSDIAARKTGPTTTQPLAPVPRPDGDLQPNRSAGLMGDIQALGQSVDGITERASVTTPTGAISQEAGTLPTTTSPSPQAEVDLVQTQAGSDRAIPEGDLPSIPAAKTAAAEVSAKSPGTLGGLTTADSALAPDAVLSGTQNLAAIPTAASAPAPITLTPSAAVAPNQVLVTAAPADIPSVISQSLASDAERPDRIIVQLDPPELGRVSIDFKFDAQGLQHITISGESPEALRQLRLMHFELIQTLERHGLSGHDMSFKQHASNQHQQSNLAAFAQPNDVETAAERPSVPVQPTLHRAVLPTDLTAGGLDIRL